MRDRLPLVASLLALIWWVPPAAGQGPPEEIPELRWISAARALDDESPDNVYPRRRRLIREQSMKFRAKFGSAAEHGLQEGRLPREKFCTVTGIGSHELFLGPDADDFGSRLLLAEVAVVATVTDIIPGFTGGAWVESLLELGDVVPLHGRSPIPEYALVPVNRVVAEDRVFCGGPFSGYDPVIGARVVAIGAWVQGVVPFGPGPGNSTMLATVQKDGESLRWYASVGPGSLVDLQARVDEAVSGNLLSLTSHLVRLKDGAKKRQRFGVEWTRRTRRGCRLVAIDEATGEQTEICIDPKAPAAAKARFEKAWRQQCEDGGNRPFAEVLVGVERTPTDICER